MDTTLTPAAARTLLADHFAPWVLDLGLDVIQIDAGQTLTRMPLTPRLMRTGGIVSGQALAAQADTSMVLALAGYVGDFVPAGTVTLDTQFLRPGTGSAIVCRATIIRAGRSLAFARAELSAEDTGKPVATATATLALP
ncbi:PaaI family thioesterase [Rhodobacteraceae bacterium N5(2021)]|uniref:PaaI family thioesterase n=1 Tax=Gymnodinialimonas phycosphaerae TaxID=2841589 RepID=A0A975YGI0_9RHOB|nr:PaaI family thioesterase [Gymnodinialimonas phycosphaerae]MBY4891726.1 PaaI family thioesterase [Gymnodinialimonas phycosphaerae]